MQKLDFLVPSALFDSAHPEAPKELLNGLSLPHLSTVAARASEDDDDVFASSGSSGEQLLTPWQRWLLRRLGAEDEEPNLAEAWALAYGAGRYPDSGSRWVIEPVQLQIGLHGVTLADPAVLDLAIEEAAALLEAARPTLARDGWLPQAATPLRWLISRRDDFYLEGAAIEQAIGRGIEPWLPFSGRAADSLAWKRTVNEIQMDWYSSPVNAAREAAGKAHVNGLWLTGNGRETNLACRYSKIESRLPLIATLPVEPSSEAELESFDQLIEPARAENWHAWRTAIEALDYRVGELIDGLRKGRFAEIRLVLCGSLRVRILTLGRGDLWKFWRRGSASDLFIEKTDGGGKQ